MKRTLSRLFSAVSLLVVPAAAWAVESSVDSTTIVRIEQRDSGTSKESLVPATQFLGLDAEKLADGNLSLHLYGWGRADLGDKSFTNDRVGGSLTYGYLQYRFRSANANLRAGRLFYHDGIANEQVDGVSARTDLPLGFGISAFGGATVHTANIFGESSDGKGDGIFGGRINYRYGGMLELGMSGLYETKAPVLLRHANGNHRLMGGDIWISPVRFVEILGHTSYNTETSHVAEHSYLLNIKPIQRLVVSGEFNQQNDRSYQYSWAILSGAAAAPTGIGATINPANESRSYGASASYQFTGINLAGDYKHYSREIGNADRFGGNARFSFMDNKARAGASYHYLRADGGFAIAPNSSGSYHELRGWAMHDTKRFFGALDFIDYIFEQKVLNEKMAWEGIASLGYHITPDLSLSGDVSYGRNPDFTEEVRGLVRLTYNLAMTGPGGR